MKKQNGFTLVELMIALAIAGILIVVAVPSFSTTIKNNQLVTQSNLLVSAFNLARSEAIKRAQTVNVCVSNATQTNCVASMDWSQGWLVWVDLDASGAPDNNEILRVSEALPPSMSLTGDVNTIQYTAQGAVNARGTFNICDDRANEIGRTVTVQNTGRATTQDQPACA